ncbi:MAG: 8-oxo-dGTP diphosphatase [Bacteroidales bacterium]|nr:8-oxo-dGTP diphosphatase [Bacteroidales bacterium]
MSILQAEKNILKITNLCYIIKDNKVLLQNKSRGFGLGKWNAPGGKKEQNESINDSVIREIKEETDLDIFDLEEVGYHEFIWKEKSEWNMKCYIFKTSSFLGVEKDMGEGILKWFDIEKIPLDEMWDDDRLWTKNMLKGEFQNMRFYFDKNNKCFKHEIIIN